MTYVKASVRRPAGNPGNGIQPKDQLVIYDVDDILSRRETMPAWLSRRIS